jgi:hypothetical protein
MFEGVRLAVAIFRIARRHVRVVGSTTWPQADGKVFQCDIVPDDLQGWAAELTYSYTALGEYYSGTYRRGFRRKKKAEAFLERFPRNTPIPVRFKAERPEVSTVLLSDVSLLLAGL